MLKNRYFVAKGNSVFPDSVVDTENGFWIPADPANADYQKYLEWLAEGNTPEPWQPE